MPRYRKRREADPVAAALPVIAFVVFCGAFVPGVGQVLGHLLQIVLAALAVVIVVLVARAFWRNAQKKREQALEFGFGSPPLGANSPAATSNGIFYRPAGLTVEPRAAPSLIWSTELLSKLEWKRFEEVVAAYWREMGYQAKTTRVGADGGVDVQLFQNGQPNPVMIIQCKAWDAYKVGVKPVRELFGVMAADKVNRGAFFTTGRFTTEADDWARDKNMDLVNGAEFVSRIGQLSLAARQRLLDVATEGDYETPTCPSCDLKMIERTAGKGRNVGSRFWGCVHYPRCKQTFKITNSS